MFQDGTVTVLYGMDRSIHAFGTVQASSGTITVDEPSTATTHFIVLTRSRSAVVAASVDYAVEGGTATPGADFTLNPGTRTWPPAARIRRSSPSTCCSTSPRATRRSGESGNPTAGTAGNPASVTITIQTTTPPAR